MKHRILLFLIIVGITFTISKLEAQIPRMFSYQGSMIDNVGKPATGNHFFTFNLYSSAAGGTALYTESQTLTVANGIFSANIGSVVALPASLHFDTTYFIGISVDAGAELTPRTPVVSSPYSLNSAHAAFAHTADTASFSAFSDLANGLTADATGVVRSINGQQGDLTLSGGGGVKVNSLGGVISISMPPFQLPLPFIASGTNDVNPLFTIQNTGFTGVAIKATDNTGGSGIAAISNATILGDGGTGYYGIAGFSNGGTPSLAGVLGRGAGPATGVAAIADMGDGITGTSNTGRAASFQIYNTANTANALEVNTSGTGNALVATSTADNTVGVHGISYGQGSTSGVFGEVTSTSSGTNAQNGPSGVLGKAGSATSTWSAGIRGINPNTNVNGYGVVGYQGGGGAGVYGETPTGAGVYGKVTDATAPAYGVLGSSASPNGAGVKATYNGNGTGSALVVDNGAIKVSGTIKSAFVRSINSAADLFTGSTIRVEIDNPLCNNDPNCMIFITETINNLALVNSGLTKQTLGIFYDTVRGKWSVISLNQQPFVFPTIINVLVIKQ